MASIIKRLKIAWRAIRGASVPGRALLLPGGGVAVGDSLSVATVYRCVRLLSESVAALPPIVKVRRGGRYEAIGGSVARLLSVEPQERLSAFEFWRQTVQHLLLRGNAYILPMLDGRQLSRLVLLQAGSVVYNWQTETYSVTDTLNGIFETYDASEIVHIRNFSTDGILGQSVLQSARQTIDICTRGDAETYERIRTGGGVIGILSSPTSFDGVGLSADGEIVDASVDVEKDLEQGRRIVPIPQTCTFQQLSLSSADLQFLETRKFEVREICRFFGVNPSFVFDDTSNNYKSAEQANAVFLSQTLNPLLRNIELELERKLLPLLGIAEGRIEFDRSAQYIADREAMVRYYGAQLGAGMRTPNELRLAEGLEALEGGDSLFISANLRPISQACEAAGKEGITNNNDNDNEQE